ERETENGCYVFENSVWISKDGQKKKIIGTKDIALLGKHNFENVIAAVMAADLAGVSRESIVEVLQAFKGLEHRLEFVRQVKGVKYFNDSFSVIPDSTIAA